MRRREAGWFGESSDNNPGRHVPSLKREFGGQGWPEASAPPRCMKSSAHLVNPPAQHGCTKIPGGSARGGGGHNPAPPPAPANPYRESLSPPPRPRCSSASPSRPQIYPSWPPSRNRLPSQSTTPSIRTVGESPCTWCYGHRHARRRDITADHRRPVIVGKYWNRTNIPPLQRTPPPRNSAKHHRTGRKCLDLPRHLSSTDGCRSPRLPSHTSSPPAQTSADLSAQHPPDAADSDSAAGLV